MLAMKVCPIVELHYLPSQAYMALLMKYPKVMLEVHETYQRRTFRNRTQVLADKGPLDLSLSLEKGNKGSVKQFIREIQLDTKAFGPKKHWRSLEVAYAKAPFFDQYAPYFEPIFLNPPTGLFDFNFQLLTMCLRFTQIDTEVVFSKDFVKDVPDSHLEVRNMISPRSSHRHFPWFRPTPYYQVFGDQFVPNLSVVDLLFNEGPRSHDILEQSVEKEVS